MSTVNLRIGLPLILGFTVGCGGADEAVGPVLPRGEWVRISTWACPDDALSDLDCTTPVGRDTLEVGRIYVQELHFVNADFLFGVLSWPVEGSRSCNDITASDRRCVLFEVWGPYELEHGNQRVAFRLGDPVQYRFEYYLLVSGTTLADTVFEWQALNAGNAATDFETSANVDFR